MIDGVVIHAARRAPATRAVGRLGDQITADVLARASEPLQEQVDRFVRQAARVETRAAHARHALLLADAEQAPAVGERRASVPPDAAEACGEHQRVAATLMTGPRSECRGDLVVGLDRPAEVLGDRKDRLVQ
jgi:hypothetical protein